MPPLEAPFYGRANARFNVQKVSLSCYILRAPCFKNSYLRYANSSTGLRIIQCTALFLSEGKKKTIMGDAPKPETGTWKSRIF